jgi:hypothetical protein
MANAARVESVDALKAFRVALLKFAESANVALSGAESDIQRTLTWLETEQMTFWQGQIRKRHELCERAKEALRMKKLYKDSSGRSPSAVEEEKAVRLAQQRLAEAEQKLGNVKRYRLRLPKEIDLYKGSVQRLATDVQVDLPTAVSQLDQMCQSLEAYIALGAAGAERAGGSEASQPTPPAAEEAKENDESRNPNDESMTK